jgi:hypothetical protein
LLEINENNQLRKSMRQPATGKEMKKILTTITGAAIIIIAGAVVEIMDMVTVGVNYCHLLFFWAKTAGWKMKPTIRKDCAPRRHRSIFSISVKRKH